MENLTPRDIAKFWMMVKIDTESKLKYSHLKCLGHCWVWQGSYFLSGYGRMGINRKTYRVHRISYYLFNGTIPNNFFVCHKCDNPNCVNPDHLFLGTAKDNVSDKIEKGRDMPPGKHKNSSSKYHGVHFFNEKESLKKWRAVVTVNYKQIRIGRFSTEIEAAKAYDEYVKELNKSLPENKKRKINFL